MEEKFTVEEIKNYIKSQDSLGDVMYFLNAENIRKANEVEIDEKSVEKCIHYDCAQGRHWCTTTLNPNRKCTGVCENYEENK
jgi:hypothetical protein